MTAALALPYVGRFAPSPSGELHLGSLTTAVSSYLHARQAQGEWLIRMEDIDPPREVAGAADSILRTLEAMDLAWDRAVLYQSTRYAEYAAAAQQLMDSGQAYLCSCSRSDIRKASGSTQRYPGTCRNRKEHLGPTAIRVRTDSSQISFHDGLQGPIHRHISAEDGDYVIYRRDELPAYHLATVIDDAFQGVNHVVRGVDLLESTAIHIHLQKCLGLGTPSYWHLPIVTNLDGQKLSKQTGAQGIRAASARAYAPKVLQLLGLNVPAELEGARPRELWEWALERWSVKQLTGKHKIQAP